MLFGGHTTTSIRWLDGNPVVFAAWSGYTTVQESSNSYVSLTSRKPDIEGNDYHHKSNKSIKTVQKLHLLTSNTNVSRHTSKYIYLASNTKYRRPAREPEQDCSAILYSSPGQHYNWVTIPCYKPYRAGFICECQKKQQVMPLNKEISAKAECLKGWYKIQENSCVYLFLRDNIT